MIAAPFAVTFFDHRSARFKREVKVTLPELREMIEVQTAERKDLLPWLKLARFGNLTTTKASLRHDANVLAVSGCEGDYDGEQISVDQAREIIEKAGVEASTICARRPGGSSIENRQITTAQRSIRRGARR